MELKTKTSRIADELDGYLKIYEIFGLQFFSLKAASRDNFQPNQSKWRTAHLFFLLAIFSFYGYIAVMGTVTAGLTTKNVLPIMHQHSISYLLLATFSTNFAQSFMSSKHMTTFFSNSEKIAGYCIREFKVEMNFAVVRKAAWRRFCALLLGFLSVLFTSAYIWSDDIIHFVLILLAFFIVFGFSFLIFIKFTFYVCFVNYQLRFLQKILLLTFKEKHAKDGVGSFSDEKSNQMMKKLLVVWKVYNKIKQNGSLVNKSCGLTMMLLILGVVMTTTFTGYEICRIVIDGLPFKHLAREFSLKISESMMTQS